MSFPTEMESQISLLSDDGGPFGQIEFESCLNWVWNSNDKQFESLAQDPSAQKVIGRILNWFKKHPRIHGHLEMGLPPRTKLQSMNPLDRLQEVEEVLHRHIQLRDNLPTTWDVQLRNQHLSVVSYHNIPQSGALRLNIVLNTTVPSQDKKTDETYIATVPIGLVKIDPTDGILRISELQKEKPKWHELDQPVPWGISRERVKHRVSKEEFRLRESVRRGRVFPRVLTENVLWPSLEELYVAAVVEQCVRAGVIHKSTPIELLYDTEIAYSLDDQYARESVLCRALGRALLTPGESYIRQLPIETEDADELIRLMHSGDASFASSTMGYEFRHAIKFPKKSNVMKKLLKSRVAKEYKDKFTDAVKGMRGEEFIRTALPYTIDYQMNYAPYIAAFADVSHQQSAYGRVFSYDDLSQLPFWKNLQLQ